MSQAINEILLHVMDECIKGNLVLSSMQTSMDGQFRIEFLGVHKIVRDEFMQEKMEELSKGTIFEGLVKSMKDKA